MQSIEFKGGHSVTQGSLPLQSSLAGNIWAAAEKGEAGGPAGRREIECRYTHLGEDVPTPGPVFRVPGVGAQQRKKCECTVNGQGQGWETAELGSILSLPSVSVNSGRQHRIPWTGWPKR